MSNRFSVWIVTPLLLVLTACVPLAELESARQASEKGDLELAHQIYLTTLKQAPDNEDVLKGLRAVRTKLTNRAIKEAAAVLRSSPGSSVPQLQLAISKLDAAKPYDPDDRLLGPTRTKYQDRITQIKNENKTRAEQVRAALTSEQFPSAKKLIEDIKKSDPQADLWRTVESDYTSKHGEFLQRRFKVLLSEKKFLEAKNVVQQLKISNTPADQIARLTKTLEEQEIRWLKAKLDHEVSNKHFYKAYLAIMESGHQKAFSALMDDLRTRGSKFYLDQATRRLKRKELSWAYLEAVKGYELDSGLPGMFEIHRRTRDEVLKKIQEYIAIPAFGAPQKNPDLGPQFSDALISYLFRILPYGINIVEREKIDLLIEEQKREFKEVGNILNVDLIITGNVSLMNIDRQKNQREATVRVKVGERKEPNPEYELLLKTYGSQVGYLANLPPRVISVPVYETFKYKKGEVVVKGFATVSARIFDTKEGRITYAQEFNAKFRAEDSYQDALEIAGVKDDPLETPTDTEVLEKLRNQIIPQLAAVIQKQFEKRERLFLGEARYYLTRREIEKVMNPLARGFLYCVKAKVKSDDSDFVALRNMILEQTEQNFLAPEIVEDEQAQNVAQEETDPPVIRNDTKVDQPEYQ